MNKVILIGRLGADPELKYTTVGKAYAKFNLATTERWKKYGEKQEKTEWHKIVSWGKLAEIMAEYLKKGSQVYLEGKLQTRMWEKEGRKHYMTEVIVETMEMLNKKNKDDAGSQSQPASQEQSEKEDLPF